MSDVRVAEELGESELSFQALAVQALAESIVGDTRTARTVLERTSAHVVRGIRTGLEWYALAVEATATRCDQLCYGLQFWDAAFPHVDVECVQTVGPHLIRHAIARPCDGETDPELVPRLLDQLRQVATNSGRRSPPAGVDDAIRWCRAIASQDVETLLAIADGYRDDGVLLLAADAYGDAAVATDNESDRARSRRQRDGLLARACDGAGGPSTPGDLPADVVELLTRSERRVAAAVATGSTNKEVAALLVCSVRTVETHLTNIYRKLDVDGRTRLTALLLGSHAA